MKVKFTTSRVTSFEKPDDKNQKLYWDSEAPGLGLRVTQTNSRAYIFQGRIGSKSPRITIGDINTWSLDDARKEARRLQQLCDQGVDPRRQKAENLEKNQLHFIQVKNNAVTLGEAWAEYLEQNRSRWGERHLADHINLSHRGGDIKERGKGLTIPGSIAALLDIPLSQITADYLVSWQTKEALTRPGQAALGFRLVRGFINWCEEHETYSNLINAKVHRAKKVRRTVPTLLPRKNAVQRAQLKNWFLAVRAIPNPVISALLQTMIINGPRSNAIKSMTYDHIDFKWHTLSIWDKVDQDYHLIPLTPYVEQLIKNLPRSQKSNYVFFSDKSKTGYLNDVRKSYHQQLKNNDLPYFTMHDLRRSFSNLTEWLDIPSGVVSQIMGHKPSATQEKHYKDRPVDLLRMHHIRIEKWILEEAGIDTVGLYDNG